MYCWYFRSEYLFCDCCEVQQQQLNQQFKTKMKNKERKKWEKILLNLIT